MDKGSAPTRVCLIAPSPPPYGGIAHWAQVVIRSFEHSDPVRITVLDSSPKSGGIQARSVLQRTLGQAPRFVRVLAKASASMVQSKTDVLHITSSGGYAVYLDFFLLAVARGLQIRAVYHLHHGQAATEIQQGTFRSLLLRVTVGMADAVIAIEPVSFRAIKQLVGSHRVFYIPNPVPDYGWVSPEQKAPVIAYVGWVTPSKGINELLESWSTIRRGFPNWELLIVGPVLQDYIDDLSTNYHFERVTFAGHRTHAAVIEYIKRAGILVLPSHAEGFPNVVLEAMSLGTPVLATAVGAVPDMLSDGCGEVVPPRDPEALASALAELMTKHEKRYLFSVAARKKSMEKYSVSAVVLQYVALWQKAGRERRRPRWSWAGKRKNRGMSLHSPSQDCETGCEKQ